MKKINTILEFFRFWLQSEQNDPKDEYDLIIDALLKTFEPKQIFSPNGVLSRLERNAIDRIHNDGYTSDHNETIIVNINFLQDIYRTDGLDGLEYAKDLLNELKTSLSMVKENRLGIIAVDLLLERNLKNIYVL